MTTEQQISYERAMNTFTIKIFNIRDVQELKILKENIELVIHEIIGDVDAVVFDALSIDLILFVDARITAENFFGKNRELLEAGIYHPCQKN